MDTTQSTTPFEDDGRPFVIEACGDTMWDEVLAQPPYNPAVRPPLPPLTLETALQKVQMAEDTWNSKEPERALMRKRFASINDLPIQADERQLSNTLPTNL